MQIGELARRSGLSRATIRYYERLGLVPSPVRGDNNYRRYPDNSLAMLESVGRLKRHGFALSEVQAFIGLFTDQKTSCKQTEPLLRGKLDELKERINELVEMQHKLERALRKCKNHPTSKACGVLADFFENDAEAHPAKKRGRT